MLELTIRLVVSLAVVVGLLLVLARFGSRKFRGGSGALVQVVHRQPLSRTSAVAVVTVGTRVLVLGTTEQQVSVLAELDPDEVDLDTEELDGPALAEVAYLPAPVLEELTVPALRTAKAPGSHRAAPNDRTKPGARVSRTTTTPGDGALAGSILSPQTWRQALGAVSHRSPRGASRRAS